MILLLAMIGIVGCVVGIIGIWRFHQNASGSVRKISDRIDVGLQRVSAANQNVQRAVGKARADVAKVGKDSADLRDGSEKSRLASRALRTFIQQQVGPNIDDLGGRLATLSETAVAVSSVLQSFQELAPSRTSLIKTDQLERWSDEVQQLSTTLRRLEGVVGEGDKETSGQEIAAATSEIELALQRCQARVDDFQTNVDAIREQVQDVKVGVLGWLTPAAIALTLLLAWVGVGQLSLFARALQWCRGA
jgi:hypothetical protein